MSNPTSNFNWQMPTNTDLVSQLPADFEVFGQAVDTSLADLKGGTTGQVLKKNTNTDMDFVWSSDATGMTNPMTTTGDTIYSSSGSTPARLGIGTAGQFLKVNSGATAPEWATLSAGGMTELASGSITTTVTLSSISSSYNELWLYVSNAYSASANSFYLQFNNVTTGAKYSQVQQFQDSITTTVGSGTTSNSWNTANAGVDINATDWLANTSGNHYVIRIPNYTTSANKLADYSVMNFSTGGTNRGIKRGTIAYFDTAAISRIDLVNATSGTYKLFGVK